MELIMRFFDLKTKEPFGQDTVNGIQNLNELVEIGRRRARRACLEGDKRLFMVEIFAKADLGKDSQGCRHFHKVPIWVARPMSDENPNLGFMERFQIEVGNLAEMKAPLGQWHVESAREMTRQ